MGKEKTSKYTFVLKGISTDKIDQLYGLTIVSNIDLSPRGKTVKSGATKLSELSDNNDPEIISFLDESKRQHKCFITMADYLTKEKIPESTGLSCFWDRHPFTTMPIGCPIRYVPSQIEKSYYSEITKDKYVIKENITKRTRYEISQDAKVAQENKKKDKKSVNLKVNEYYETDGNFCSFNCVLAFIDDEIRKKEHCVYKDSKHLLIKMYTEIFGVIPKNLVKSPSWRLLQEFGGHLTVADYRKNFNRIEYKEVAKVRELPRCKSIGIVFEEKVKL